MNYKMYMQENHLSNLGVGINTRLSNTLRISSIYRRWDCDGINVYGWETFLWDGERIEKQYDVLYSAEDVVNLHMKIKSDLDFASN